MAKNYVVALPNNVVDVSESYTFGPEDAIASLTTDWTTGGTITLPGVDATGEPPNNGDTYGIADPQNVLSNGSKTLIVNGGGYKFLAFVASAAGLVSSATFGSLLFNHLDEGSSALRAGLLFVFDAAAQIWIVL